MNFHTNTLLYDHLKKIEPSIAQEGPSRFYRDGLSRLQREYRETGNRQAITAYNQSHSELFWHEAGRPYFKVFPNLLSMFMRTKLDVPGKYLHSPFPQFLIRLSENHGCEELTVGGHELKTILVTETSRENVERIKDEPLDYSHMFIVWMDFGETFDGVPYYLYQVMKFRSEETIEESIARQRTPEKTDKATLAYGLDIGNEKINNCMRLVVSTCFLATGADRIVEPDVLSRDLQRYIEAQRSKNTERVQHLHKRAQKRGKKGWTLGREITIPSSSKSGSSEPSGEHLAYQHQRGAHFHVYHYGPGRSKWKVKWITQLTVRPDLPLPPAQTKRGYKAK